MPRNSTAIPTLPSRARYRAALENAKRNEPTSPAVSFRHRHSASFRAAKAARLVAPEDQAKLEKRLEKRRNDKNATNNNNGNGNIQMPASPTASGALWARLGHSLATAKQQVATAASSPELEPIGKGSRRRALRQAADALLSHPLFEVAINLLVVLNCAALGLTTDAKQHQLTDLSAFAAFDNVCLGVFCFELALRLFVDGVPMLWQDFWTALDGFIVFSGLLDALFALANAGVGLPSTLQLRVLRLLRLAQIGRMVGQFRMLWMLARGLFAAVQTLVWAFLLFIVILYMFAILCVEIVGKSDEFVIYPDADVLADIAATDAYYQQLANGVLRSTSAAPSALSDEYQRKYEEQQLYLGLGGDGDFHVYRPDATSQMVSQRFNDIPAAMISCLQISTLDGWIGEFLLPVGRRLPVAVVLFLLIMAVSALALMNLLTATIVERAIEGAREDEEFVRQQEELELQRQIARIEAFLTSMDQDGDGLITFQELKQAFEPPAPPSSLATHSLPGGRRGSIMARATSGGILADTSALDIRASQQPASYLSRSEGNDGRPGGADGLEPPAGSSVTFRNPIDERRGSEDLSNNKNNTNNGPDNTTNNGPAPPGAVAERSQEKSTHAEPRHRAPPPSSGNLNGSEKSLPVSTANRAASDAVTRSGGLDLAAVARTASRVQRSAKQAAKKAKTREQREYYERVDELDAMKKTLGNMDEVLLIFNLCADDGLTDAAERSVPIAQLCEMISLYHHDEGKFLNLNLMNRVTKIHGALRRLERAQAQSAHLRPGALARSAPGLRAPPSASAALPRATIYNATMPSPESPLLPAHSAPARESTALETTNETGSEAANEAGNDAPAIDLHHELQALRLANARLHAENGRLQDAQDEMNRKLDLVLKRLATRDEASGDATAVDPRLTHTEH